MNRFIVPEWNETEQMYKWNEIEVKRSLDPAAGFGLFAKRCLPKNLYIPYYGEEIQRYLTRDDDDNMYLVEIEPGHYLDGTPALRLVEQEQVIPGLRGKAMAAFANEPSAKEKANAVLITESKYNPVTEAFCHLLLIKRIKKNEEIKVHYNYSDETDREYVVGRAATF